MHTKIKNIFIEIQTVLEKIPAIVYIGHSALRRKAGGVSVDEGKRVAMKLQKALLKYRSLFDVGRGIAAPQIGESKAVFVTFIGDRFQVYCNPLIVRHSSTKNYFRETCLSARELWCEVRRPESVIMEWTDELGKKQTRSFSGFEARLIQHEYDHLQGVVCIDIAERGSIAYCVGDVTKEKLRKIASPRHQMLGSQ